MKTRTILRWETTLGNLGTIENIRQYWKKGYLCSQVVYLDQTHRYGTGGLTFQPALEVITKVSHGLEHPASRADHKRHLRDRTVAHKRLGSTPADFKRLEA